MKLPENCENMDEIRAEIDALDREIIRLLGARFGYVKAAAKFKTDAAGVRAPERFAAMLEARRAWALEENLSPDAVEKMYRDLVEYFIAEEAQHLQARSEK